jgi:predicted short-subunit dehydrogenase-like oxidoreductase (DUF2520 family)
LRGLDIACSLGSFHPLQSFSDPAVAADRFSGCYVACEGDKRALAEGHDLAARLGAKSVSISAEAKVAYHAAAVMASNYLAVLTELAIRLYKLVGITPEQGIEMLAPLQGGVLENMRSVGLPDALTGPIARGDVETVRAHLEVLRASLPTLVGPYVEMGRAAARMAKAMGQPETKVAAILDALDPITAGRPV